MLAFVITAKPWYLQLHELTQPANESQKSGVQQDRHSLCCPPLEQLLSVYFCFVTGSLGGVSCVLPKLTSEVLDVSLVFTKWGGGGHGGTPFLFTVYNEDSYNNLFRAEREEKIDEKCKSLIVIAKDISGISRAS